MSKYKKLSHVIDYCVLLLFILCWCLPSQAMERGTVSGRVLDKTSRHPIPGANVSVEGTVLGVSTNSEGFFELSSVPTGSYRVRASAMGYTSSTVDMTVTLRV